MNVFVVTHLNGADLREQTAHEDPRDAFKHYNDLARDFAGTPAFGFESAEDLARGATLFTVSGGVTIFAKGLELRSSG
jgi:hypothetical protein